MRIITMECPVYTSIMDGLINANRAGMVNLVVGSWMKRVISRLGEKKKSRIPNWNFVSFQTNKINPFVSWELSEKNKLPILNKLQKKKQKLTNELFLPWKFSWNNL